MKRAQPVCTALPWLAALLGHDLSSWKTGRQSSVRQPREANFIDPGKVGAVVLLVLPCPPRAV